MEKVSVGEWGIVYNPKRIQSPFINDFKHTYVGMGGGIANGKTWALCRKCLVIITLIPGVEVLLGQVTEGQINRSILPEFAKALLGHRGTPGSIASHPSVKNYSVKNMRVEFVNGSVVTFYAVGERSKGTAMVEKLLSTTYGWIGLDQADVMHEDVFDYLDGRNRQKLQVSFDGKIRNFRNQIAITYNPEGYSHWIYQRFIEKRRELVGNNGDKYFVYEHTTADGELLSEDKISDLRNKPEDFRKRFFEGMWGAFADQVYKEWNDLYHIIPPFKVPHGWDWYLIFDYGYSAPSCFLIFAVSRKCLETPDIPENVVFCVWEHYAAELTPKEHAAIVLRELVKTTYFEKEGRSYEIPRNFVEYLCDPTVISGKNSRGLTVADEYSECGIDFNPAINDQFLGVEHTLDLLQIRGDRAATVREVLQQVYGDNPGSIPSGFDVEAPQMMFFKNCCPHTVKELPSIRASEQSYNGSRGNFLKERQKDHGADCVRYMAAHFMEYQSPEPKQTLSDRYKKVLDSRRRSKRWQEFNPGQGSPAHLRRSPYRLPA